MRSWKVLVPLFLLCSMAFASESRLPFGTVFKGQDQFNRLVAKAKAGNWKALPIGERTAAVGALAITFHVCITWRTGCTTIIDEVLLKISPATWVGVAFHIPRGR